MGNSEVKVSLHLVSYVALHPQVWKEDRESAFPLKEGSPLTTWSVFIAGLDGPGVSPLLRSQAIQVLD